MNAIIFKKKRLTRTVVVNNILRVYDKCGDEHRVDWYQAAHMFAFDISKGLENDWVWVKLQKACGVVAALSPMKTWEQNKVCALTMVETGVAKHTECFSNKAKRILESDGEIDTIMDILNGNKIQSFFMNILKPETSDEITIDRHALSVALGGWIEDDMAQGITMSQYEFFVNCYKLAGLKRQIRGVLMQSATWMRFRENKKDYKRINRKTWK